MKKKIAFQGEAGAYSEMAAIKIFPNSIIQPFKSFQEVFDSVSSQQSDYGVIPIENSLEGSVNENYDLLLKKEVKVIGEIFQKINHCLIVNKDYKEIQSVYSHPQALAQCRNYIYNKKWEAIPIYDTAGAVKTIKEKSLLNSAAIASKRAAFIYKMNILEENIQDNKNNYTRFFIISKDIDTDYTGNDRTSLIFSVKHEPGSLFSIIEEFAKRKINLTKIESRPTKEIPWEYYFFVDFEGHIKNKVIFETLEIIRKKTQLFKILGSYKKDHLE